MNQVKDVSLILSPSASTTPLGPTPPVATFCLHPSAKKSARSVCVYLLTLKCQVCLSVFMC